MLDAYISDHEINCIDLDLPKPTDHKISFSCRLLKKIDVSEFNKDIAAALSTVKHFDLNSPVHCFNSTLTLILDKHAPLITVTVTPRNKNPWFTPNLLTERRKRRQLERTRRNSRNEADRLLHKNQCHLSNSLVKKAQSNYFHL